MPLQTPIKGENHLMTKAIRAGHRLDHLVEHRVEIRSSTARGGEWAQTCS